MGQRPLAPDDRQAWDRLAATVIPLAGQAVLRPPVASVVETPAPRSVATPARSTAAPARVRPVSDTLDGGWDRRLRRGSVAPDRAIDLHGHTLASAHAALDEALGLAVADGARVLLVVTGKPPRAGEARRGLIRANIFDWLAHSRHAGALAAVRNAHPRHGGAGALYLILRRRRGG